MRGMHILVRLAVGWGTPPVGEDSPVAVEGSLVAAVVRSPSGAAAASVAGGSPGVAAGEGIHSIPPWGCRTEEPC